jgi:hypothetical protein
MTGRELLAVLIGTSLMVAARAETPGGAPPGLAPGQQWSIKSAAPTTAKVIIDRLESWHSKTAVHISIIDLPVPQGLPGAGGTTVATHMPFEQSALAASLDRLLATGVSPPSGFESGYKSWHDANGGIFTVSVEKAIEFTLETLGRGQSPR